MYMGMLACWQGNHVHMGMLGCWQGSYMGMLACRLSSSVMHIVGSVIASHYFDVFLLEWETWSESTDRGRSCSTTDHGGSQQDLPTASPTPLLCTPSYSKSSIYESIPPPHSRS